ncbi:MAG: DUF3108 domain-containing protein [Nitrospinaceae bacterium]|nr:DUF3108 domain-containing protein [Nitrospinaceae bacterium]NIU43630.1 DUF3108 domain-containing protein [Nitrospinaceae bacterium]NIU95749.1 DUF3108 domain-containing protein [Nitrospinaceae bacterium]NIW58397.1 DUF3108 domain-containing protein [Nitrospinaceae bacterium]
MILIGYLNPRALESAPAEEPDRTPGLYPSFQPEGDMRRFAGERLHYDISLLWFSNAAEAQVGFYESGGNFYSVLEAQTKGVIGFFTAYRKHVYKTTFELLENNRRLRAKTFERKVIEGGKVERTLHFFDYNQRIHWWYDYVNEDLVGTGKDPIPAGIHFDDVLTAFYNFRNGVYGKIQKGSEYHIKTIPEKGHDEISIFIRPQQETEESRKKQNPISGGEYLVDIRVPKELFLTKEGKLTVWGSKHLIPLETTVKDYVLLGDLHANFRTREYQPPSVPQVPATSALEAPLP